MVGAVAVGDVGAVGIEFDKLGECDGKVGLRRLKNLTLVTRG